MAQLLRKEACLTQVDVVSLVFSLVPTEQGAIPRAMFLSYFGRPQNSCPCVNDSDTTSSGHAQRTEPSARRETVLDIALVTVPVEDVVAYRKGGLSGQELSSYVPAAI